MKRHVQTTGVRKWSGDALVELQREPLRAFEAFLQGIGACVIQGCRVTQAADGTYDVAPGFVALGGIERGVKGDQNVERILVMPFGGVQGVAMPMFLVPREAVENRAYNDGATKPVAYTWQAVYSATQPESGSYLVFTASSGAASWRDVMQDKTHRMVSDAKINAWDAKADKSGTYPNMSAGYAETAGEADSAGSADHATRADQDAQGNDIAATYLKKSGDTMSGTLVQHKDTAALLHDVASAAIPNAHTGWIVADFGDAAVMFSAEIVLRSYLYGHLVISFSGYTYASGANWYCPFYGFSGSWGTTLPQVLFVKDSEGRRKILIGGENYPWGSLGTVAMTRAVLSGLTEAPVAFSFVSGSLEELGLTATTTWASGAHGLNEGIEVARARTLPVGAVTTAMLAGRCVTGAKLASDLTLPGTPQVAVPSGLNGASGDIATIGNLNAVKDGVEDGTIIAGRAVADTQGNDIPLTYATKGELPGKATSEADGLLSKEDKIALDDIIDSAGKPVIFARITDIPETAGQDCTIISRTASGVTVSVKRAVTGFTVQHNLNTADYYVVITPIDSFNYTVGQSETMIGINTSTHWPFDAESRAWGRFSIAVFRYK